MDLVYLVYQPIFKMSVLVPRILISLDHVKCMDAGLW